MNLSYLAYWPRNVPRHLTIPATSLCCNVDVSAARFGAKTFLQFYGTSVSYAEFKAAVDRLAAWLQQQGVGEGDRVVLDLQNSPQFAIAYYAILRADAVVVPVNPMNRSEELRHVVRDSGARLAVVGQENWDVMSGIPADVLPRILVAAYSDYLDEGSRQRAPDFVREPRRIFRDPRATLWTDAFAADLRPAASTVGPDDHAAIIYTSGTTGAPKGALHTHHSAMATVLATMQWHNSQQDEVVLAVLPFFHVTGMQCSMSGPLYVGATVVLLPRWNAVEAARLISEYRVTSWTVIPTMVVDFLSNEEVHAYDLSSLRKIGGGGAALPGEIARKLEEMRLSYIEGYGLTETMAPTHINPPERAKRHRRSGARRRGRLLLHRRPPETDDQRCGVQGMACGGRDAHARTSGHQGGLRGRHEGRLPRRDGKGRYRAETGVPRYHDRGRDHRVVPPTYGRLQGAARDQLHRCTPPIRYREDSPAHAAGLSDLRIADCRPRGRVLHCG
jgi:fatty-acyl-CoA synthase